MNQDRRWLSENNLQILHLQQEHIGES